MRGPECWPAHSKAAALWHQSFSSLIQRGDVSNFKCSICAHNVKAAFWQWQCRTCFLFLGKNPCQLGTGKVDQWQHMFYTSQIIWLLLLAVFAWFDFQDMTFCWNIWQYMELVVALASFCKTLLPGHKAQLGWYCANVSPSWKKGSFKCYCESFFL